MYRLDYPPVYSRGDEKTAKLTTEFRRARASLFSLIDRVQLVRAAYINGDCTIPNEWLTPYSVGIKPLVELAQLLQVSWEVM